MSDAGSMSSSCASPTFRRFISNFLVAEDPLPCYSKLDQLDGLPERSTTP